MGYPFFGGKSSWGTPFFTNFEVLPQGSIVYFYGRTRGWVPPPLNTILLILVIRAILVLPCPPWGDTDLPSGYAVKILALLVAEES